MSMSQSGICSVGASRYWAMRGTTALRACGFAEPWTALVRESDPISRCVVTAEAGTVMWDAALVIVSDYHPALAVAFACQVAADLADSRGALAEGGRRAIQELVRDARAASRREEDRG